MKRLPAPFAVELAGGSRTKTRFPSGTWRSLEFMSQYSRWVLFRFALIDRLMSSLACKDWEKEVQVANQMRVSLEREHVFQAPGGKELCDLFQVLVKCCGHTL